MIPQFNTFPEDSVTLNLVSMANIYDFYEELAYRLDYAERSYRTVDPQSQLPRASETNIMPFIWNLNDSPPDPPGISAPIDKNVSEYVSTSDAGLLEDLEGAHRNPGEYLLFIILGLDGTDKLNPWVINEYDKVFQEPTSLVHIYTAKDRQRTIHDLKRYMRDKESVVSYVRNGRAMEAKPVMGQMDVFLYMLDRMGWTYRTHIHPDSSEREMFASPVPSKENDPMDPIEIKQTAVFESQRYFTDVEETNMAFKSI